MSLKKALSVAILLSQILLCRYLINLFIDLNTLGHLLKKSRVCFYQHVFVIIIIIFLLEGLDPLVVIREIPTLHILLSANKIGKKSGHANCAIASVAHCASVMRIAQSHQC